MIAYPVNQIKVGIIPAEQEFSTVINGCKWKGNPLERENYGRLRLTDEILKIADTIIEKLVRQKVNIAEMQFCFMDESQTLFLS